MLVPFPRRGTVLHVASKRSSRTDLLGVVLGLAIVLGAFTWVLTRGDGAPPADTGATQTTVPAPAPQPCDDAATDSGACPSPELVNSDTLEGAVERLVKGSPRDTDARFLLLGEDDWSVLFADALGPAVLAPGGEFLPTGVLADAVGSRELRFSFQEEWQVQRGGVLVQQLLLLEDPVAAAEVVSGFRTSAVKAGLTELKDPALEKDFRSKLGADAFSSSFVNPGAVGFFADRRCAVQTVAAAGPVVLVVTFFEGSGCTTAKAFPAMVTVSALRGRVLEILENRDF